MFGLKMRKRRELLTPDLTPVIDIVFILLIFFMVTSVFKKEEVSLVLNLPSLHTSSKTNNVKSIVFELTQDALHVEQKHYTFQTLDSALKSIKSDDIIKIKIDKNVVYDRVMQLFDKLQNHDLTNFSLMAKQNKDN